MTHLLDTNAWIVYLKSPQTRIRERLEKLRPGDVALCSVVKAELWHGAEKYGHRAHRLELLQQTFAPYNSLPFDDAAAAEYGRLRHQLEAAGQVLGPNDLMIAAIALTNRLTLVTHNTSEFGRVMGLSVEDWQ